MSQTSLYFLSSTPFFLPHALDFTVEKMLPVKAQKKTGAIAVPLQSGSDNPRVPAFSALIHRNRFLTLLLNVITKNSPYCKTKHWWKIPNEREKWVEISNTCLLFNGDNMSSYFVWSCVLLCFFSEFDSVQNPVKWLAMMWQSRRTWLIHTSDACFMLCNITISAHTVAARLSGLGSLLFVGFCSCYLYDVIVA